MNMSSRFLGLVVVPGEFITKIELEEYHDVEKPSEPCLNTTDAPA